MKKTTKRNLITLTIILAVIAAMLFAIPAIAEWDGTGNPIVGNSSATEGSFHIHANSTDLVGYRFHVFSKNTDGSGVMLGHGIDVYTSNLMLHSTVKRNLDKPFHDDSDIRLGTMVGSNPLPYLKSNEYMYNDLRVPLDITNVATQMGGWLTDPDVQKDILSFCGVSTRPTASFYITCEPIYTGHTDSGRYVLTISEWAKMQSAYYAEDALPTGSDGTYNWIASWLGNRYLASLYTNNNYTLDGRTILSPASYLTSWTETVGGVNTTCYGMRLPEASTGISMRVRNLPIRMWQYGVGLGVYIQTPANVTIQYNANLGYTVNNMPASPQYASRNSTAKIDSKSPRTDYGYIFAGWGLSSSATTPNYYAIISTNNKICY